MLPRPIPDTARRPRYWRPFLWLPAFVQEHLSPSDRYGEMLCGLIMVLTFTLVAGPLVDEGRKGVLQLLAAAAGCNLAWGVIDGVLYVLQCVGRRVRRGRLALAARAAAGEDEACAILRPELDALLGDLGAAKDRARVYAAVHELIERGEVPGPRADRSDLMGGGAILLIQVFSCLPALVPFAVLDEPTLALRVSNGLLLLMLFGVGVQWADEVGTRRLTAAVVIASIGAALVSVSILLGG